MSTATMIIATDLFQFAYIPGWYTQLDTLAEMAMPEPWAFSDPSYSTKNPYTPILERYIQIIFRKQAIEYNTAATDEQAEKHFYVRNQVACFHTGLYTKNFKPIYACFDRNKKLDSMCTWYFKCFAEDISPWMKYIQPLPQKPRFDMPMNGAYFHTDWDIRVNMNHILGDEENVSRIPENVRSFPNLSLLLETGVETARRKAVIEPGIVVPQGYQGRVQYLLPIYLTDPNQPDLAMTLTCMDGYYLGNTCLTLEMAYLNARCLSRPHAMWLCALTQ